jgi:hypothetical protein
MVGMQLRSDKQPRHRENVGALGWYECCGLHSMAKSFQLKTQNSTHLVINYTIRIRIYAGLDGLEAWMHRRKHIDSHEHVKGCIF